MAKEYEDYQAPCVKVPWNAPGDRVAEGEVGPVPPERGAKKGKPKPKPPRPY